MKKMSLILSVVILLVFIIPSNKVYAQKEVYIYEDSLCKYAEKLEQLNKEFGTSYVLSPMQSISMKSLEKFITSMTIEEFETYVRKAHEKSLASGVPTSDLIDTSPNDYEENSNRSIQDTPYLATQRCVTDSIYGGIDVQNYFYITIYTNYVNGQYIYVSNYSSSGAVINHYPGYEVYGSYGVLGGNNTYIDVTYSCARRITELIVDMTIHTITVRYVAGQGDYWPTT